MSKKLAFLATALALMVFTVLASANSANYLNRMTDAQGTIALVGTTTAIVPARWATTIDDVGMPMTMPAATSADRNYIGEFSLVSIGHSSRLINYYAYTNDVMDPVQSVATRQRQLSGQINSWMISQISGATANFRTVLKCSICAERANSGIESFLVTNPAMNRLQTGEKSVVARKTLRAA